MKNAWPPKSETRNPKFEANPKSKSRDVQYQHDWEVSRGACVSSKSNLFRISIFGFRAEGVLDLTRYANGSPLGLSRGAVGDARLTFMHTENAQGLLAAIF
jgi:hypothetical protein